MLLKPADMRLRCVDYCLEVAGIEPDEIDLVVTNDLVYERMLRGFEHAQVINHHLAHAELLLPVVRERALGGDRHRRLRLGDRIARRRPMSYFLGEGTELRRIWRSDGNVHLRGNQSIFSWRHFDHVEGSLGGFYSFVSEAIGFGPMEEGEMMGLAPYGSERLCGAIAAICRLDDGGDLPLRPARARRARLADRGDACRRHVARQQCSRPTPISLAPRRSRSRSGSSPTPTASRR